MLLTQDQFQKHYDQGQLRLCFIGMSNIGKSHCGRLLRDGFGFELYEVDGAIQQAMAIPDMDEASTWMGYPYEAKYAQNEAYYLELETDKTQNAPLPENKNFVLDTTGSAIYLSPQIHQFLRENFLIVSFDVSHSMVADMTAEFFKTPKTVVWGDSFNQRENEQGINALRRCYPALLADRIARYRDLADVTVPGEFSRLKGLEAARLFEVIKLSLPKSLEG